MSKNEELRLLLKTLSKSAGKPKADWNGHPVLDPEHVPALEQNAAINQFRDGLPQEEAEKKAYAEYTKTQRAEAGYHHLKSAKIALMSGDMETARKHGTLYQIHNQALGGSLVGPSHPDIQKLEKVPAEGKQKFKIHPADMFLGEMEKSEKREQVTCRCPALRFPHRHKSHPKCPEKAVPKG